MTRKRFRSARRHESAPLLNLNDSSYPPGRTQRPRLEPSAMRSENILTSNTSLHEDYDNLPRASLPEHELNTDTTGLIPVLSCDGLIPDDGESTVAPNQALITTSDILDDEALLLEDNASSSASSDTLDIDYRVPRCVQIGRKTWKSANHLLAAFLTRGGDSLTRSNYEMILRLMFPLLTDLNRAQPPSYSTLLRSVYPFLKTYCLPKIELFPRAALTSTEKIATRAPLDKTASVITPSSWALYDVQNYTFYRSVFDSRRTEDPLSFNNSPLVVSRDIILDEKNQLLVPSESSFIRLRKNDKMEIFLVSIPKQNVPGITRNGRQAVIRAEITNFIVGRPSDMSETPKFLRPGDLTTRFSIMDLNDTAKWYLTSRFWVTSENKQRFIVHREKGGKLQQFQVHRVDGSPAIRTPPPGEKSNSGLLPDGTPYVVYRFILFHDNFEVARTLLRKHSIGGVYLLPADLPSYQKTAPSSIRTISLTPPNMSSVEVLEFISDDIRVGTTEGFLGRDPYGAPIRIFLDLCGVLADFHEASDGFQTLNHSGIAGCNLCNFRKNVSKFKKASKHGHSLTSHSRNSAFMRTTWRHFDLHEARISADDANFLGMKLSSGGAKSGPTFLELDRRLSEQTSLLQLDHIVWHYKAYPCSIVGPDHCIVGNIKNVLKATFFVLQSNSERSILNNYFSETLERLGLPRQQFVYNLKSKELNSTSFSNTFSIFSVAPSVLHLYSSNRISALDSKFYRMKRVFFILFRLVNLLMFFPNPDSGEIQEMNDIFGLRRECYFRKVQKYALLYVSCVNFMVRNDHPAGSILDKPNLHRLLELTVHTIPTYGHVHHVSDLTFEHKHQSLKRAHHRANNHQKGNHHWAVRMEVYDQWKNRLTSAFGRMASAQSNSEHIRTARIELYTLLFGKDATDLLSPEHEQYRQGLDRSIVHMFSEPLRKELSYRSHISDGTTSWISPQAIWSLRGKRLSLDKFGEKQSFSELLRVRLRVSIASKFQNDSTPLRGISYKAARNSTKSDTVCSGSIIQKTTTNAEGSSVRVTLYVLGFFSDKNMTHFVFGYPISDLLTCPNVVDPPLPRYLYEPFNEATVLQIWPLGSNIRRVAEYPICARGCIPESTRQCHAIPTGIPIFIQNRPTGYPPHSA